MKKLMIAAMAMAAGAAFADTAIQSANVVGYNTNYLDSESGSPNFQIATHFKPMTVSGKWRIGEKIFDTDAQAADKIIFFDKDLNDIVTYMFLGYEGDVSQGWYKSWLDGFGEEKDDMVESFEVIKGETLYFEPSDGVSGMTVSGETEDVEGSVKLSFPLAETYNFVNPYPIATKFSDVESFVIAGDRFVVYEESLNDIVTYMYIGEDDMPWLKNWLDGFGEDQYDYPQSEDVLFPIGRGGFYCPCDENGREWTVSLKKN